MGNKILDREIFDKAMKKIGYGTMTIQLELDKANVFYGVIFTHWFAKAFWGVVPAHLNLDEYAESTYTGKPNWQHHLQQMVLEENPLKYLERFL